MSEPGPQGPAASRFAPARLRAAALREEIDATRADLGATVAELAHHEHEAQDAGGPQAAGRGIDHEFSQPKAVEAQPAAEWQSPAVSLGRARSRGASRAPLPIAAAAMTFAAALGAGLLVRRR